MYVVCIVWRAKYLFLHLNKSSCSSQSIHFSLDSNCTTIKLWDNFLQRCIIQDFNIFLPSAFLIHCFFIRMSNISVSDFSRVVYQSRNGESLFNHKSIISMCTLETMKLKSVPQYTELCESKVIKCNIKYGYGILCNMTSNHLKKSIFLILIHHIIRLRFL